MNRHVYPVETTSGAADANGSPRHRKVGASQKDSVMGRQRLSI
jgi:hypothetical protein